MTEEREQKISEFVRACHRVAEYGLLKYSSGNMSYRLDADLIAVSARGAWLAEISSDGVAVCTLADGRVLNGVKPTAESEFHLGILRSRNDVNVVLHFQSPFATAIACGRRITRHFNVIPELPIYIGEVGIVEYLPPGSKELAEKVVSAVQTHDLVILQNHGQVVVGKDYDDAIQKAGFFELACQILMRQDEPDFIPPGQESYGENP